jgi:hypothetical protein
MFLIDLVNVFQFIRCNLLGFLLFIFVWSDFIYSSILFFMMY